VRPEGQKLAASQLNLPHGTKKTQKIKGKTKNKNQFGQKEYYG